MIVPSTQVLFTKNVALVTGPNDPTTARKLKAWIGGMPSYGKDIPLLDIARIRPPIGMELDGASGTCRYIGDKNWPTMLHEALSSSMTAGSGSSSIFVRVCQDGDTAHVCGTHEKELLEALMIDNTTDHKGVRSIFQVRIFDLRPASNVNDADIDAALDAARHFAHRSQLGVQVNQASLSPLSSTCYTDTTTAIHRRTCDANFAMIDQLMSKCRIQIERRGAGVSPVASVRLPRVSRCVVTGARTETLAVFAGVVGTYVHASIGATCPPPSSASTVEPQRQMWGGRRDSTTPPAAGVHPRNRRSASPADWLGPPPRTSMFGSAMSETDVLNIQNIDGDALVPPSSITPPPIAPHEPAMVVNVTMAVNDDAMEPTTRRVSIDDRAGGLPQPSTTVIPPAWVCCTHGEHHEHLTQWYQWLIGHCGCDESSIMSFFALLQYNPDAYAACTQIIEEIAGTEDRAYIRNYSAKLARLVNTARNRVHPDGSEHAGKPVVVVEADTW